MKKLFCRGTYIALVSLLLVMGTGQSSQAQDVSVSYQTFYDNLAPYGQWVQDPQYGDVWVPNEGGDFRPYGSRGHWVMTDYGNTWVSEDPWGWACYHYGRWTYDSYYGWVWVPGYEWAPAWVTWRYGGGYSGWAPLGPGISVGVSYNCPDSWWIFVQPQYMYTNDCYSHWRGPSYNNTYIRQTAVINNYYMDNGTHVRYNYGPHADDIQRDTHQPVQVYRVSRMRSPGAPVVQNNRVSLYRPAVNRATATTARPTNVIQAPRQIGKPQAATNMNAGRQPEFRQQVQRQQGQPQPGAANPRVNNNQPASRPQQTQPQGRPQPQPQSRPQVQPQTQNRPQPQPQSRPQVQPQPQGRPQPQPQSRPQVQPQPQNRPQPQPQSRPQVQPQPQNRPQPQPQNRPEPMRQEQQPRSQPQMQPVQQPQRQEAPRQEAPRQEAPRQEGGRR